MKSTDEDLEMLFGILDDENDGEINTDKCICLHVDMFAFVDVEQTDNNVWKKPGSHKAW